MEHDFFEINGAIFELFQDVTISSSTHDVLRGAFLLTSDTSNASIFSNKQTEFLDIAACSVRPMPNQ